MLLASLGETPQDLNYVPYESISQLPYDHIDVIDEFITGATQMMLRSYEMATDREHFTQMLVLLAQISRFLNPENTSR